MTVSSFEAKDIALLELCLTAAGGTLPVVENPSSWQERHLALLEALSTALAGFGGGSLTEMPANRLFGNPTGDATAPTTIPLAGSLAFSGGALTVATDGVALGMIENATVGEVLIGNPTSSAGAFTQVPLGDGLGFVAGELAVPDGSIWIEKIEDLPADIVLGRLNSLGGPETLPLSRDGTYSGDAANTVASMAAVEASLQDVAIFQHKESPSVDGGSLAAGVNVRVLNQTVKGQSWASRSGSEITLQAGFKYYLRAYLAHYGVDSFKSYLYNSTDSVTEILGMPGSAVSYASGTKNSQAIGLIFGEVDLSAALVDKAFELRENCTFGQAGNGAGFAISDGQDNVYAYVEVARTG